MVSRDSCSETRLDRILQIDERTADRIAYSFLFVVTLVRLGILWLSPLDLAPDEAHYWEWSRRLDWAYYSKGPIVALLIAASTRVFGESEFAVRFPALLCQTLFFGLLYVGVRRFATAALGLLMLLAANSFLIFSAMGLVMTTDAPTALCWILSLLFAADAIQANRSRSWIPCFLFLGLTVLAKYTACLWFASLWLFLLVTPEVRRHLRSKEFWFGQVLFVSLLLPVVLWNSQHGWVNFAHNAGHVGGDRAMPLTLRYFGELVGGQLGLLGPIAAFVFFAPIVVALRRYRELSSLARMFLFATLPLLALCLVVSLTRRVYANWPMPSYIGLLFLFACLCNRGLLSGSRLRRWIVPGLVVSALLTVAAHLPFVGLTFGLPGKILPTKRLVGWKALAQEAQQILEARASGKEWIILAEDYETASELAFYVRPHPRTFVPMVGTRRMNQYDVWAGWQDLKEKDALLVLKVPAVAEEISPYFANISPNIQSFQYPYSGTTVRTFSFLWASQYSGIPMPLPQKR